jgi:hypothetical protein
MRGSILMIKDQFWENVVLSRLNLDEKGKIFAESIHFMEDFFLLIGTENRTQNPGSREFENRNRTRT